MIDIFTKICYDISEQNTIIVMRKTENATLRLIEGQQKKENTGINRILIESKAALSSFTKLKLR